MKPDPTEFQQVADEPKPRAEERQPAGIAELVEQIKETADKLVRDKANRGDVKLLNTALKELRYSFKILAAYRQRRKVTVFGSARLKTDHAAYKSAVDFSRKMVEAGFMVITGAAEGIMEAGHVGAGREQSIGINILLPFEQGANRIIQGDNKLMHMRYFFTRKLLFVKECDGIALFPGGFGTQDECFEVLTLVQTGKSHLFPIVMVDEPGGDYWKRWRVYVEEVLLRRKLISPADMALFKVTDSLEDATAEVVDFYRVYHSMRYVRNDLVFRLNRAISEEALEQINNDFSDILVSGKFQLTHSLPEETEDAHIAMLPRLRFRFDRRNMGRLRMLIDTLNQSAEVAPTDL
jgi:hypothetical protein